MIDVNGRDVITSKNEPDLSTVEDGLKVDMHQNSYKDLRGQVPDISHVCESTG